MGDATTNLIARKPSVGLSIELPDGRKLKTDAMAWLAKLGVEFLGG